MKKYIEIAKSQPDDIVRIEKIYEDAFPDEDLLPLVRELLQQGQGVLSLNGVHENIIVGHICFTFCTIEKNEGRVALLAPLAVAPSMQKQGVGSALVRAGFKHLEKAGISRAFVLGDPAYYTRFGFEREDKVIPPYRLPSQWHEAWQSAKLFDTKTVFEGRLLVPEVWQQKALWLP